MSRRGKLETALEGLYKGVAHANQAFWLSLIGAIRHPGAVQNVTFDAMQKTGALTPMMRAYDEKASIQLAQLIFVNIGLSLMAAAGPLESVKRGVRLAKQSEPMTVAEVAVSVFDLVAALNALAFLALIVFNSLNMGNTRKVTLDTLVKQDLATPLEVQMNPEACLMAAKLLMGIIAMAPYAARTAVSDATRLVGMIRNSCFNRPAPQLAVPLLNEGDATNPQAVRTSSETRVVEVRPDDTGEHPDDRPAQSHSRLTA